MASQFDDLWQNPKHWKWHLVYICQQDPRIVVPERHKWMGYTFNFAHRSAYLLTLTMFLVVLIPSLDAIRDGRIQDLPLTLAFSAVFAIILVLVVSRVGRQ
jgi:hypothetical protein